MTPTPTRPTAVPIEPADHGHPLAAATGVLSALVLGAMLWILIARAVWP